MTLTPADLDRLVRAMQAQLRECAQTIEFLHDCLKSPDTYKYEYPKQTEEELARIGKLAPPIEGCFHSRRMAGCKRCDAVAKEYELLQWLETKQARKLLKLLEGNEL